jgi:hypothetical protein
MREKLMARRVLPPGHDRRSTDLNRAYACFAFSSRQPRICPACSR